MRSLRRTARPIDDVSAAPVVLAQSQAHACWPPKGPRRPDGDTTLPDRPSAALRVNSRKIAGIAQHASATQPDRCRPASPPLASPPRAGGPATRPVRLVCGTEGAAGQPYVSPSRSERRCAGIRPGAEPPDRDVAAGSEGSHPLGVAGDGPTGRNGGAAGRRNPTMRPRKTLSRAVKKLERNSPGGQRGFGIARIFSCAKQRSVCTKCAPVFHRPVHMRRPPAHAAIAAAALPAGGRERWNRPAESLFAPQHGH